MLAGAGSALAVRATVPPFDLAPIALFGWVPLLVLAGRAPLRIVLSAAGLQGVLLNLSAHEWVVIGLERGASASPWAAFGAWILLAVLQGLRTPLVLVLVHWAALARCPIWVSFPTLQAAAEILFPGIFPWGLALEVHAVPHWLQAASLGGAGAVTLWIGLVNGLLSCAVARLRTRSGFAFAGTAAVVVALVSGMGHMALVGVDKRQSQAASGRILVAHYRTPVEQTRTEPVPVLRKSTLTHLATSGPVDFVIWPETVVEQPTPTRRLPQLARDYLIRDRQEGNRGGIVRVPLLFGAVIGDGGVSITLRSWFEILGLFSGGTIRKGSFRSASRAALSRGCRNWRQWYP
jgi:apolipoprotein N-acyltransferase